MKKAEVLKRQKRTAKNETKEFLSGGGRCRGGMQDMSGGNGEEKKKKDNIQDVH